MQIKGTSARISLEDIPEAHPAFQFHRLWSHHVKHFGAFERQNFDPMTAPSVLPWLTLIDIDESEEKHPRYKFRLYGTGIAELFGTDFTGQYITNQASKDFKSHLEDGFKAARKTMQPQFSKTHIPLPRREFIKIYRGVFPTRATETHAQQIIVVVSSIDQYINPIQLEAFV